MAIFQLPTRSPIKYRGKHPFRVRMWSYSRSRSQQIVAEHLGMTRPVHIEVYAGYRFIADMSDLRRDGVKCNVEMEACLNNPAADIHDLTQVRYDAMLDAIRAENLL